MVDLSTVVFVRCWYLFGGSPTAHTGELYVRTKTAVQLDYWFDQHTNCPSYFPRLSASCYVVISLQKVS